MARSREWFVGEYLPQQYAKIAGQFQGLSSPGCFALRIGDAAWSLRIDRGELFVDRGAGEEALLSIGLSNDDLAALIDILEADHPEEVRAFPLAPFSWDAETAALVRQLPGGILVEIIDDQRGDPPANERRYRVSIAPGSRLPAAGELEQSGCRVECRMSDLLRVRAGNENPMQLFLDGKLQLSGNVQIALALGGLLSR